MFDECSYLFLMLYLSLWLGLSWFYQLLDILILCSILNQVLLHLLPWLDIKFRGIYVVNDLNLRM